MPFMPDAEGSAFRAAAAPRHRAPTPPSARRRVHKEHAARRLRTSTDQFRLRPREQIDGIPCHRGQSGIDPCFAPRWYVQRADIDESALTPVKLQTFCPYKGLCSYYNIGEAHLAAWSYPDAYVEVGRISNFVSFEPAIVTVHLDGFQLHLEPGQEVIPHGPDRNLTVDEAARPAHLRERAPASL
jgi:hypothetical protein